MSGCCTPEGYRRLFHERGAEAQARRYRRRGLDAVSRTIVELVKQRGVAGRSVLEVGGGVGAIQVELLKAGAAAATSVELTPTYERSAAELLDELGLTGRVDRRLMDFAAEGAQVERADVVVLNRVLCCYHDMPGLAGEAADHAGELLVLSFPRRRLWTRCAVAAANFGLWVTRRRFHLFLHPPSRIREVAESRGLRTVYDRPGMLWEVLALERS